MQIRIVNVGSPETKQGKKAAYSVFELTFSVDGNERKRKIMSFDKDCYKTLKEAKVGEVYDITARQNGEYWDWVKVEKVGGEAAAATSGAQGATRSGGNWETADERAKKQIYIVRQSSIANAIAYYGNTQADVSVDDVINTAKKFEKYVFSVEAVGDNDLFNEDVVQ